MTVIRSIVRGTGSVLPERIMSNMDFAGIVETSDEWIVQRTGIRNRHIASDSETTVSLAEGAARKALEAAEDALRTAERAARDAADDRASLESERDDLREQLADLEGELLDSARAVERTEKERKKAARAVDRARAALDD